MGQILENGYKMKTTFWNDFTIADCFGIDAIEDTYKRSFRNWKTNTEYITELTMVLNWKCFYYYQKNNDVLYKLYQELYWKCNDWCMNNLKGKDLIYFIKTTD